MIKQKQSARYLKYAIGEIILVVIGILIALQINNWNENRKDSAEEQKMLLNLNTEFKTNLKKLDASILGLEKSLKGMDSILNIMNKTIPFDQDPKTLDRLISQMINNPRFFPSSIVLKELEASGKLAKLKDPKLKATLYSWNSSQDELMVSVSISNNSYKDCLDYIKSNASIRRIDFAADQGVSQTILSESNLHLLADLKFENVLDDHYILLGLRRDTYKEAAQIIKSIIEQTEPSKL
jgi:hypothetical protein